MVKFFKSLLCVAFMMVVMCSSEVYASEISTENDSQEVEEMNVSSRTTGTFTSTLTAYFDSTHYFDIVVYLYMDYSWEDGSYGWINEAYTIGYSDETYLSYVESSTIAILDPPRLEDFGYITDNTYFERYNFYGTKVHGLEFYEYEGHIWIYASVDEWGEVSVWITFDECDENCEELHTIA